MSATMNGIEYDGEATACELCGAAGSTKLGANAGQQWLRATFLPGDWNRKVTVACGPCERAPENTTIRGTVCSAHFGMRREQAGSMADVLACSDCQEANAKRAAEIQAGHTIDPGQEYGAHIALTCADHPDLRWTTKNIDFIGARSLFFAGWDQGQNECPCPMSKLRVVS